jgi:hypothetical protein
MTVVVKFIAPPLGVLMTSNFWYDLRGIRGPEVWWFYLTPLLAVAAVIWHGWRLKWVAIDDTNERLYVSNYRREIAIPLANSLNVTES